MKVSALAILLVGFLSVFQASHASEIQARENGASWGNTRAASEPIKDPVRRGHWWWPRVPASNEGDMEVWGNSGVVYRRWDRQEPIRPQEPPLPPVHPYVCHGGPPCEVILFRLDSVELDACARCQLDRVVEYMNEHPKDTVEIVGHTCDLGDEEYNEALGQRRADAVLKHLLESGVERDRLSAKSMGESLPAVPNDSPENRRLNRRVYFETTIIE